MADLATEPDNVNLVGVGVQPLAGEDDQGDRADDHQGDDQPVLHSLRSLAGQLLACGVRSRQG
ncbi:MAG: hypothetical protein ACKOE2_04010, partial [Actinomycetales bacterium]